MLAEQLHLLSVQNSFIYIFLVALIIEIKSFTFVLPTHANKMIEQKGSARFRNDKGNN
jgi:hypothetical protein